MALNHHEQLDTKRVRFVEAISFLIGFSSAIFVYVMSAYFKEASGSENVGWFYSIAYLVVLVLLLNLHKFVHRLGKANVFYFSLLLKIITLFFLVRLTPSALSIGILMAYIILELLQWVSLDVILESFSKDEVSGRIRGMHLTIFNLGFLMAPFLSTKILEQFGFGGIFMFMLFFNSVVLVISLMLIRDVNHRCSQRLGVRALLQKVWKRKDIMKIYYVSFALECFFALMVIYTSLYLLDLGFSWTNIGKIFTIMLIPFVVLQYPMGLLADKKTGEKEFLIFALFIMGAAALGIGITHSNNFAVWAGLLLISRIGAALIEVLRDSYFYKRIDDQDVDLINFFRTATPVGYIFATSCSSLLLLIFPLQAVFIFTALIVFSAIGVALKIKDNKAELEKNY